MAKTGPSPEAGMPLPCGEALPHPVQAGDAVTIYRLVLARPPLIEGRATLLDLLDPSRGLCRVRFLGEAIPRERLVHPGLWQADPEAMLRALRGHWRMSFRPDALAGFLTADASRDGGEA